MIAVRDIPGVLAFVLKVGALSFGEILSSARSVHVLMETSKHEKTDRRQYVRGRFTPLIDSIKSDRALVGTTQTHRIEGRCMHVTPGPGITDPVEQECAVIVADQLARLAGSQSAQVHFPQIFG